MFLLELQKDQWYACNLVSYADKVVVNFSQSNEPSKRLLQELDIDSYEQMRKIEVKDELMLPDFVQEIEMSNWTSFSKMNCANTVVAGTFDISGNKNVRSLQNCPKQVGTLIASSCNLLTLNCQHLTVNKLKISFNPKLQSLTGGPKVAHKIFAGFCGLTSLKTNTVVKELEANNNSLESLKDCPPELDLLTLDSPLSKHNVLSLSGRCKELYLIATNTRMKIKSVFRFKLDLLRQGQKSTI